MWHRKQCARWNRANKEYFKGNYLHRKLADCSGPAPAGNSGSNSEVLRFPASRIQLHLPRSDIAEVLPAKAVITIEYIVAQIIARIHPVQRATRKLSAMNNSP